MECYPALKKNGVLPWLGGFVGWSIVLYTEKVAGWIPSQGTYLGCEFIPWTWHMWEVADRCFSLTSMFLSLYLSPPPTPLSLSRLKKKKEILSHKTTWMNLEDIMWSKITNYRRTNTARFHSPEGSKIFKVIEVDSRMIIKKTFNIYFFSNF